MKKGVEGMRKQPCVSQEDEYRMLQRSMDKSTVYVPKQIYLLFCHYETHFSQVFQLFPDVKERSLQQVTNTVPSIYL